MSILLMNRVWNAEMPSATHKLILLAFADHANDEGLCWPSIKRIASRAQLSRRQAQRIIHDLQNTGLLVVVQSARRHAAPLYEIRGDKLSPLPDLEVSSEPLGVTNPTLGVTNPTLGVTPMSPKPSLRITNKPPDESVTFFEKRYRAHKVLP